MYNILPLFFIIISLGIIIFIVARKSSLLASIDVDSIPAEKEAQVKEMIISKRMQRNVTRWSSKLMIVFNFFGQKLSSFGKWLLEKLKNLRDHYEIESEKSVNGEEGAITNLFRDFEELNEKEEYEAAEKKLIDIIALDSRNFEAWNLLGKLYYEQKKYEEAKQTFSHLAKLIEEDNSEADPSEAFFNLTLSYKENEEGEEALASIKKALEKHPNNPRYLDTMLEISIMNKVKVPALDAFKKLKEANPENNKLSEWQEQIRAL